MVGVEEEEKGRTYEGANDEHALYAAPNDESGLVAEADVFLESGGDEVDSDVVLLGGRPQG